MMIFNGMMPIVQGWALFNSPTGNYNPAGGWNAVSIGNQYNCNTQLNSTTNIGGCQPVSENGGLFSQLISGFGDWLTATFKFILTFGIGVVLPGLFLVNTFGVPISFAAAYTVGMYVMYAAFFSYFFGFRSPESGT